MTQEEKDLLLRDLCARLPYGFKYQVRYDDDDTSVRDVEKFILDDEYSLFDAWMVHEIKPYLRPMSSMTEDEGKELENLLSEIDAHCWVYNDNAYERISFVSNNDYTDTEIAEVYTDWLNKKMFDWRELIKKGLAIEAPEGMYN